MASEHHPSDKTGGRKYAMKPIEAPPAGVIDGSDIEESDTEQPMPTKNLPEISGYSDANFTTATAIPAPPPEDSPRKSNPPDVDFKRLLGMSEEDVRDALLTWVSQHCCYGSQAAQHMHIKKIEPTMALYYTLETFTESRSVMYKHVPYNAGAVDHPGTESGPPQAWDINVPPPSLFQKSTYKVEIPKTSLIQKCHTCKGRGWNRCRLCHGTKKNKCGKCQGKGKKKVQSGNQMFYIDCKICSRTGKRTCTRCNGKARVVCITCKGVQKLRCFLELTSTFLIHLNDYILEETDMPDELIRGVQGDVVFTQTLPQVCPLDDSPLHPLNENCKKLIELHRNGFPGEKNLHQRQVLKGVPVTEVHYTWKDKESRFWVYGKERSIHCPDYPQTCCCGCQII